MKVTLSHNAGFCPGVMRADKLIRSLIAGKGENERIFTLGKLIHNKSYCDELESLGVFSIEYDEVEATLKALADKRVTLVIRTHGVTREKYEALLSLTECFPNFTLVDMTCPSVKRIHKIAEENTSDDTVFLLFSKSTHPEAVGIMSYAAGEKHHISSPDELC